MDPFQFSNKYYGFGSEILRNDKTYKKLLAEKLVDFLSNPALELPIRYTLEDFLVYFQIRSQKTQDRTVEKRKFFFFKTQETETELVNKTREELIEELIPFT